MVTIDRTEDNCNIVMTKIFTSVCKREGRTMEDSYDEPSAIQ